MNKSKQYICFEYGKENVLQPLSTDLSEWQDRTYPIRFPEGIIDRCYFERDLIYNKEEDIFIISEQSKVDSVSLAAFDYLEKCKNNRGMCSHQNDRLVRLLADRKVYISKYISEDDSSNERIQMYVDFIKRNNIQIKEVLNIP